VRSRRAEWREEVSASVETLTYPLSSVSVWMVRLLTPDSLETAHFNCGHPHRTGLVYKPRHAILVGQLLSSILAACSGVRPITLYN
jgi:hypothetical protein